MMGSVIKQTSVDGARPARRVALRWVVAHASALGLGGLALPAGAAAQSTAGAAVRAPNASVTAAIAPAAVSAGAATTGSKAAPKTRTLLVVGDSLSAEYGLARGQGWVALLEKRLKEPRVDITSDRKVGVQADNSAGAKAERTAGANAAKTTRANAPWQVVNASISGDTTSGGRSRLPALLAQHKPTLVVLELGANDALRGLPLNLTEANLTAMARAAKTAGAKVLVVGIAVPPNYGRQYGEDFYALFGKVARAEGAALAPFLLAGVADGPEPEALFQADRIHPKAQAHPRMLDNVWVALRPLLQ
jgi:acyl-CoA thioesterase I